MNKQPVVVSLFSGAGGLDVGLENAGFQVALCLDNDPVAIGTLKHNQAKGVVRPDGRRYLAETTILQEDIAQLTEVRLRATLRHDEVDLLVGGPPCQPFSSAGKMLGFFDPRGELFSHFARVAAELKPRYVLFENVRGLATARGYDAQPGSALREVLRRFENLGYYTNVALLNAADFGAYQRRVRLFILMCRGATPPEFPPPTHFDPERWSPELSLFGEEGGVLPWRTLGDFLAGRSAPPTEEWVRPSPRLAALLRDLPEGSGLKSAGTIETTRPGGHWGYKQGTFIADSKRPARTITAASTQDWVRTTSGECRRLTVAECKELQGFPVEWEFLGPRAAQYRQIGNAVPAVFGEVLGRAIHDHRCQRRRTRFVETGAKSFPLPLQIVAAIRYTEREEARNGESRRLKAAKGLGSASTGAGGD